MPAFELLPYLPVGEQWPSDVTWTAFPSFIEALQNALWEKGYLPPGTYEAGGYDRATAMALAQYARDKSLPLVWDAFAGCEVYSSLGISADTVKCLVGVTDRIVGGYPGNLCYDLPSETCEKEEEKPAPGEEEKGLKKVLSYALIGSAAVLTAWGVSRRT